MSTCYNKQVMLYIIDELEMLDDNFSEKFQKLLSNDRFTKYQRLHSSLNKNASVAVYLLLRLGLRDVYGIDEIVEFDYAERGKPYLKDYPNIHFSLSHSHNIAACAISNVSVGVDVQKINHISDKVAKRVLTSDEYELFLKSSTPNDYFCKIWTMKESYLKQSGVGITLELNTIASESICDKKYFKKDNYYCCVCAKEAEIMQVRYIGRDCFEQLYCR
ncbi:MAG: 4'-phosphopantetheinyl transferase superfamily protein [Oscillospiraceae bacterium]|nr:4'-phosphopantetheinyl transferase superfamily protein [Oscillospiraceae bacterium]